MNYYNEIDPFACERLEYLMRKGIISRGFIDNRSIEDVIPAELEQYNQCHFFAGIGMWSYALRLAGVSDDESVWTGSCPCQPFSQAGQGKGFADERHLWPAFHWLIERCAPPVVFGEQVGKKLGLEWFRLVQNDLEGVGYFTWSCEFPAASVGYPHIRQRLYWCGLADSHKYGRERRICKWENKERQVFNGQIGCDGSVGGMEYPYGNGWGERKGNSERDRQRFSSPSTGEALEWVECADGKWRPVEPGIALLVDGYSKRSSLLRVIGNSIVPKQAAIFIQTIMEV